MNEQEIDNLLTNIGITGTQEDLKKLCALYAKIGTKLAEMKGAIEDAGIA